MIWLFKDSDTLPSYQTTEVKNYHTWQYKLFISSIPVAVGILG